MSRELTGCIERLIEFSTHGPFLKEMEAAKAEFFHPEEHVFEDDKAFERRMALFFDWYVFDRPFSRGKTPLEVFLEDNAALSPEERAVFRGFRGNIHSLFEVLKNSQPVIVVRDLYTRKKHSAHEEDNPLIFQKGFLFEGRLLPWRGRECFSGALYFHPPEVKKLLAKELKRARKAGADAIGILLRRFFMLAVRWERYRHVNPVKIYQSGLDEYAKTAGH